MTVQRAIEAALPELQAEAEARMTSRATIRRTTGRTTQDETTGREVPVWETVHTDIPCRVAGSKSASPSRTEEDGGVERTYSLRTLSLPIATTGLRDGNLAEITSGDTAGLVFRMVEVDRADQQTALRVPVEQVPRPNEWG